MDREPGKRGRFIGGGAGVQAIVLIVGFALVVLLIALTSLIVRDFVRQLPTDREAPNRPVAWPSTEPTRTPEQAQRGPVEAGAVRPLTPSSWVTSDDYPLDAIRAGLEGAASFTLDVSDIGRPVACRITQSSGHLVLDEATCALMMKRARFRPAADAAGVPITARYSSRVRWVLPE